MSTDYENSTALKYSLLGAFSSSESPDDWDVEEYKVKISHLSDYDAHDCAFQAALRGSSSKLDFH